MNVPPADPAGVVALITCSGVDGPEIALRVKAANGGDVWRTPTAIVYDSEVITIMRMAVVAHTDTAELGLILDDATRNGEVTLAQLSYALREHRARGLAPLLHPVAVDVAVLAASTSPRPAQRPASNTAARKKTAAAERGQA